MRASPPRGRARAARPAAAPPRRARRGLRRRAACAGAGLSAAASADRGDSSTTDRDVHEEDRPPAGAEDVGRHEDAAQHLTGTRAECNDCRRRGPAPAPGTAPWKLRWMRLKTWGTMSAAPAPWTTRKTISTSLVGGEAAGEGRGRKHAQAAEEHAPEADEAAEPGAGDQQHGVGDHVAGDDQLELRAGGVEVEADRGRRDVDDRGVEDGHELAGEDGGEQPPQAGPRRATPSREARLVERLIGH